MEGSILQNTLKDVNHAEWLDQEQLAKVARELMKSLNIVKAANSDYEICRQTLRDIYNRGQSRGRYEAQD